MMPTSSETPSSESTKDPGKAVRCRVAKRPTFVAIEAAVPLLATTVAALFVFFKTHAVESASAVAVATIEDFFVLCRFSEFVFEF